MTACACVAGYFGPNGAACEQCAAGLYKAAPGNALIDAKAAVDEQQDIAKAKVDPHGKTS